MPSNPQQFDQMYLHELRALKGWPSPHGLDFAAPVAPGVIINAGGGVSLNAAGQLIIGIKRHWQGLFAIQNSADFDVMASGVTITGYQPITPSGILNCLVADGPFELQTTEFDTTQTYNINDPLRCDTTTGLVTNQSVVLASQTNTPQTNSTACCGIVSRGVSVNNYGQTVLAFWPKWYPGRSGE